ncbi:MAG: hypothetical protein Q8M44_00520 [bacterium]|nr:hypothetical protein [bacterium]
MNIILAKSINSSSLNVDNTQSDTSNLSLYHIQILILLKSSQNNLIISFIQLCHQALHLFLYLIFQKSILKSS